MNKDDDPRDRIERQFEAFRCRFISKFKEAKLIDIWGIITGTSLVILGIIGACIYGCQLSEMKRSNDLADKALKAQTRPWIGIDGDLAVDSYLETKDGPQLKIAVPLKNYGHSPAIIADPPVFVISYLIKPFPYEWNYDICQNVEFVTIREPGSNSAHFVARHTYPVFQNQRDPDILHVGVGVRNDLGRIAPLDTKKLPYLSGCVPYNFANGKPIYRTRVIYHIKYADKTTTASDGTIYYPIVGFERWYLDAN
jgi:hypothetical protein